MRRCRPGWLLALARTVSVFSPFKDAVLWVRLPLAEQRITLEALATVIAARAAVAALPPAKLSRLVQRAMRSSAPRRGRGVPTNSCTLSSVRIAILRASARIPGASCLTQALAGWWLLRRRGIDSELRVGVNRGGEGLTAHAWLLVEGQVLLGGRDPEARYVPLG